MEKTRSIIKFAPLLLFFLGVGAGFFIFHLIDTRGGVAHVESVIRTGDNTESIIKNNCNTGCGDYIRIIQKGQPDKWYDKDELCGCLNNGQRLDACPELTLRPLGSVTCIHY